MISALQIYAVNIKFYCDEAPPYNYSEENKITGIAVDWLEEMFEITGNKYKTEDIKLVPWARGYNLLLNKPNTCMFSVARTDERENKFLWVGPISEVTIVLLAKKEHNIKINNNDDLKKYSITTMKNDISEFALLKKGLNKKDLEYSSNNTENFLKLKKGRVDLWACEKSVASFEINNSDKPDEYVCAAILEKSELYFAFNKKTRKEDIKELQTAFNKLKKKNYKDLNDFKEYPFLKH